jgi:HAD superfamily hydrolase (TIGR01484 family)
MEDTNSATVDITRKKLAVFDLDKTLAASKSKITDRMAKSFSTLISRIKVAIISGGDFPQFQTQVLSRLPIDGQNFSNLIIVPTSGTKLFVWKGDWTEVYNESLTPKEKEKILSSLNTALRLGGYMKPDKSYGDIIEDRGSQITFSALGQQAPVAEKDAWDPDRKKREAIAAIARPSLPEFDVRIGGSTSIDITKRGINKAYGIRKLEQYLSVSADDIVFVGDTLFYGGNDYPARATGVDCIQVRGPEETENIIDNWNNSLAS